MSKKLAIKAFDPNSAGSGENIFGLPLDFQNSRLHLLSVPFEATTSYLGGTSAAPRKILEASQQVDLFHPVYGDVWRQGIALLPLKKSQKVVSLNRDALKLVRQSRKAKAGSPKKEKLLQQVNRLCSQMNEWVLTQSRKILDEGKILGVIGGDHSIPFGSITENLRKYPKMGILHLDAHFDLRRGYEGFTYSHASIFYNVISRLPISSLVQIGIRDYCEEELRFAESQPSIRFMTDAQLFERKAKGHLWERICDEILQWLPKEVYLSFDIDGLDPSFCPQTGTPVPGGLSFSEIVYLVRKIVASGRKIVGFDLCEVGAGEWDANVGARLLFEMSLATLRSH